MRLSIVRGSTSARLDAAARDLGFFVSSVPRPGKLAPHEGLDEAQSFLAPELGQGPRGGHSRRLGENEPPAGPAVEIAMRRATVRDPLGASAAAQPFSSRGVQRTRRAAGLSPSACDRTATWETSRTAGPL